MTLAPWLLVGCLNQALPPFHKVLRGQSGALCNTWVYGGGSQAGSTVALWNTAGRTLKVDASLLLLLLLSRFGRVRLCAARQAPLSLGFSRQEHRSGLPFPSPMHESEKWKWSRSVVLLATPWTAAYQAPPSMGFSRQEDWSGVPLPSPRWLTRTLQMSLLLLCHCWSKRKIPIFSIIEKIIQGLPVT